MNKDMYYICLFVILFTLYLRSEYNTNSKIEKMSNASDIKAQINNIYKTDIESIRNLAEISQKLQKGGLEIPGALTIKGKLNANNIQSNTIVSLETKLNALQSKLTTLTNQSNSKISQINTMLTDINKYRGLNLNLTTTSSEYIGKNTTTTSVIKRGAPALSGNHYIITSVITIQNHSSSGWKNIYHYGNNNGERIPALFLFPNNIWGCHFRVGTYANGNDGMDFAIPPQFREFNTPITISVLLDVEGGNSRIIAYVNGMFAGTTVIRSIPYNYASRNFYIKDPWHKKDGFNVESVHIRKLR